MFRTSQVTVDIPRRRYVASEPRASARAVNRQTFFCGITGGGTVVARWTVAVLAVLLAQRTVAQSPAEPDRAAPSELTTDLESGVPSDADQTAEIERLISLLASPEYSRRKEATVRLTEIGVIAYRRLHAAFHESDDLEVKLLIEQIVRDSWLAHRVFDRIGFLGISRKIEALPSHDSDPRISQGHVGIAVGSVIENTGAARAGLKVDDVIVALDGVPIKGDDVVAFSSFAESIRERGAGARASLTVLRGAEVKEIEATLGPAPRDGLSTVQGLRGLYRSAVSNLETWWFDEFRKPPDATSGVLSIPDVQPISDDE